MDDPVLVVLAGPNGAGKSTLFTEVLGPILHLEFVNADVIAAERRAELLDARQSFVTETVFSHPSKVELLRDAAALGYRVSLHTIAIPEELAVARVANRVEVGGHAVPEDKVRSRYRRLWLHLHEGIAIADDAVVYDNSLASAPLRVVARFINGVLVGDPTWPEWMPAELASESLAPRLGDHPGSVTGSGRNSF